MEIPEGWTISRLDQLPSSRSRPVTKLGPFGSAIKKSDYTSEGFKVYGQQQVLSGDENFGDYWVAQEKYDKLSACAVLPGDILLSTMGTPGYVLRLSENALAGIINPRLMRISVCHDIADPLFLELHLKSDLAQRQFFGFRQGRTMPAINGKSVNSVKVLLPPLPEQRRIAEILGTWDQAIAVTEALIDQSEAQKKALMQQLLTGKRRLPGFEGEWKSYRLSELEDESWIELGRGRVISRKDIAVFPGDNPIYSSSVKNNGLFGTYSKYDFDQKMITWSVDGGGHFFFRPKHKFSITNVSGWMKIDEQKIDCLFLALQLQRLHASLQFDYQTKAHPSVIRQLYTVRLPSLEEQKAVAGVLSTSSNYIDGLQAKLQTLKTEKAALMQQLLTGKRRVKLTEAA